MGFESRRIVSMNEDVTDSGSFQTPILNDHCLSHHGIREWKASRDGSLNASRPDRRWFSANDFQRPVNSGKTDRSFRHNRIETV